MLKFHSTYPSTPESRPVIIKFESFFNVRFSFKAIGEHIYEYRCIKAFSNPGIR